MGKLFRDPQGGRFVSVPIPSGCLLSSRHTHTHSHVRTRVSCLRSSTPRLRMCSRFPVAQAPKAGLALSPFAHLAGRASPVAGSLNPRLNLPLPRALPKSRTDLIPRAPLTRAHTRALSRSHSRRSHSRHSHAGAAVRGTAVSHNNTRPGSPRRGLDSGVAGAATASRSGRARSGRPRRGRGPGPGRRRRRGRGPGGRRAAAAAAARGGG